MNINLVGEADRTISKLPLPETYAIKPPSFIGLTPNLLVKQGDEVKAGSPLFSDKNNDAIKFCSPVSGEVIDIIRGEKRKVLEIKLLADKEISYDNFPIVNPDAIRQGNYFTDHAK